MLLHQQVSLIISLKSDFLALSKHLFLVYMKSLRYTMNLRIVCCSLLINVFHTRTQVKIHLLQIGTYLQISYQVRGKSRLYDCVSYKNKKMCFLHNETKNTSKQLKIICIHKFIILFIILFI